MSSTEELSAFNNTTTDSTSITDNMAVDTTPTNDTSTSATSATSAADEPPKEEPSSIGTRC